MAKFEVTRYEVYTRKYMVEANSPAEVLLKMNNKDCVSIPDTLEFVRTADEYDSTALENLEFDHPGLMDEMEELGLCLKETPICNIKGI